MPPCICSSLHPSSHLCFRSSVAAHCSTKVGKLLFCLIVLPSSLMFNSLQAPIDNTSVFSKFTLSPCCLKVSLCLGPQCTGTPHGSRSDWALHLALLDIIKDGLSKLDRFARTFRRTAEAFLCTKWHTTLWHASRGSTYCSTIKPARARTLTKPGRNSSQRRTMYS